MGIHFYFKRIAVSICVLLGMRILWFDVMGVYEDVQNIRGSRNLPFDFDIERKILLQEKVLLDENVLQDRKTLQERNEPRVEIKELPEQMSLEEYKKKLQVDRIKFVGRSHPDFKEFQGGPSEKHHLVFLKVHKTGSSTVQNIFLRYAYERNLTLVLPHTNKTTGAETNYPNMISYKNTLSDDNIIPPPPGRHYDVLCCHVIYNGVQFRKYMPGDSTYIGIVRDPVTRLESSMRYFNMFPDVPLSDFADNPLAYDKKLPSMTNNRMAYEFGFPLELFPVPDRKSDIDIGKGIERYLHQLFNEFDLILINERLDDCLVYMRRILGWTMKDIFYQRKLVAKKETRRFTDDEKLKLKSYLYLDYALYDFAVKIFDSLFVMQGEDIVNEVILFKKVLTTVQIFCEDKEPKDAIEHIKRSKWNEEFAFTKGDCKLLETFEIGFIQKIREQLYGTKLN